MSAIGRPECVPLRVIQKVLKEIGILTLLKAPKDVHLLILGKFFRMFGFGQVSIILVQFFKLLGISEQKTGTFMSMALLGDVAISFLLTVIADGVGRKRVMLVGSVLMGFSGLVFAFNENYTVLLIVCIVGLISPSGNDLGPFRAIEESSIAHILPLTQRSDVYGWYGVIGGIGASCGSMSAGWITQILEDSFGYTRLDSYKVLFMNYAFLALLKALFTLMLSEKIEVENDGGTSAAIAEVEAERLLPEDMADIGCHTEERPSSSCQAGCFTNLFPRLSIESRKILVFMSTLFALDSLASSMTPTSWISYYIETKFEPNDGVVGSIFFVVGVTSSVSSLGGLSIARRLGPLLTMVVTHLPSSIILGFIPFAKTLRVTVMLLIMRACTQKMDVAPKQAFISSVVHHNERTTVMGFINLVNTGSQILGVYFTGFMAEKKIQWLCFVLSGSLKGLYDLGILGFFMSSQGKHLEGPKLPARDIAHIES